MKSGIDIAVQAVKQCCSLCEQIRADILLGLCAKQLFSGNIFYGIKSQFATLCSETGTIYIGAFRVRLHGVAVFQRGSCHGAIADQTSGDRSESGGACRCKCVDGGSLIAILNIQGQPQIIDGAVFCCDKTDQPTGIGIIRCQKGRGMVGTVK